MHFGINLEKILIVLVKEKTSFFSLDINEVGLTGNVFYDQTISLEVIYPVSYF